MLLSSFGFLTIGIARFFRGIQAKEFPLWYRILIFVVGCVGIIISILVGLTNSDVIIIIANPNTQVILFATLLILLALARISVVFLKKLDGIDKV